MVINTLNTDIIDRLYFWCRPFVDLIGVNLPFNARIVPPSVDVIAGEESL
jgi:hypothetical protein